MLVTPHVGVWIETVNQVVRELPALSHLMQVCGLKLLDMRSEMKKRGSHLMQVCGLKQICRCHRKDGIRSHLMQVCGLKHSQSDNFHIDPPSHLMQVCGLKLYHDSISAISVIMLVDYWVGKIPNYSFTLLMAEGIYSTYSHISFISNFKRII